jgi:hypothetical protein
MDSNSAQFLPKTTSLPGSLHERYVRCGKRGCRCQRGVPHGPYFRLVWREDGRTRSRYVRADEAADVQSALARWRREHPSTRSLVREVRQLARVLRESYE